MIRLVSALFCACLLMSTADRAEALSDSEYQTLLSRYETEVQGMCDEVAALTQTVKDAELTNTILMDQWDTSVRILESQIERKGKDDLKLFSTTAEEVANGTLTQSDNPKISALIAERRAGIARIDDIRGSSLLVAVDALDEARFKLDRARAQKEALKKKVAELKTRPRRINNPGGSGQGVIRPDVEAELEQVPVTMLQVAALIASVRKDLVGTVANPAVLKAVRDALLSVYGNPLELPGRVRPLDLEQARRVGLVGDGGVGTTTPPRIWTVTGGIGGHWTDDPTFEAFGQEPQMRSGGAIWLGAERRLQGGGPVGWDSYLTFDLMHARNTYRNHINIVGGAVGASSGSMNSTYLGAGLKFERQVGPNTWIGVAPGLGALHVDMDGSFTASGTVAAAKLEAFARVAFGENGAFVPSVYGLFPLGDVSGAGGATPSNVNLRESAGLRLSFEFRF